MKTDNLPHTALITLFRWVFLLIVCTGSVTLPASLAAQTDTTETATEEQATPPADAGVIEIMREPIDQFEHPSLISQAAALTIMSLSPFIIMILTSFVKIVVVLVSRATIFKKLMIILYGTNQKVMVIFRMTLPKK